jgi:UPF0271 protein
MQFVSSINLACGAHAGDPLIIKMFTAAARARGVAVGAHPSYPDLQGFGLREMVMAPAELGAHVQAQIAMLDGFVRIGGGRLQHVKFHGALAHVVSRDRTAARAAAEAVAEYDRSLIVLLLRPGTELEAACREVGLPVATEGYLDRAYHADGSLVSRHRPDALITDPQVVAQRALQLVMDGTVVSVEGPLVAVHPQSLCLHSDTPKALEILAAVRRALTSAGIAVRPLRSDDHAPGE